MPKYAAFLRAINVGSHLVKMADLKRLFEELGFEDVTTFIASGNVVFEANDNATALEQRIEKHLEKELGYRVATFLRTTKELSKIAAARPFGEPGDDEIVYVAFVRQKPSAAVQKKIAALRNEVDDIKA